MNILLVNIPNTGARSGFAGLFLPMGMAQISAVLARNGHNCDCIDLHTEQILAGKELDPILTVIGRVRLTEYDIIAFGGCFLSFAVLKELSTRIAAMHPAAIQIIGGNLASTIPVIILQNTPISCVVLQEGEQTVVELVEALQNRRDLAAVAGITFRDCNGAIITTGAREKIEQLDSLPFPDRSKWGFDTIRKAFPFGSPGRYSAILFASRGCPFSCIFCNPLSGKKVRSRSPEHIVAEMKLLKERWNICYFRFFDEVFIGDKAKIRELCHLMLRERLAVFWWCQTQIRLVDRELLTLMKEAGCIEIGYGIESGNNMILAEMNKGITKEMAREVIEMTRQTGIRPSLSVIAGSPAETVETLDETTAFICSLNHINWTQIPQFGFLVPIPGTRYYETARERGVIRDEEQYLCHGMTNRDKYSNPLNLTTIPDQSLARHVADCNARIRRNFYRRHPLKFLLSRVGLDHLRLDLLFRHFSLSQLRPLAEAILYAMIGKRDARLGRTIGEFIYRRPPCQTSELGPKPSERVTPPILSPK